MKRATCSFRRFVCVARHSMKFPIAYNRTCRLAAGNAAVKGRCQMTWLDIWMVGGLVLLVVLVVLRKKGR